MGSDQWELVCHHRVGEAVWAIRLSSDYGLAAGRGLSGEPQAGEDLASGGAEGAAAAAEAGQVVAGGWLVHPATAGAGEPRLGLRLRRGPALVAGLPPARPGNGANGQVADQLRSRRSCDGPLRFRLDHSMGTGHFQGLSSRRAPSGSGGWACSTSRMRSAACGRAKRSARARSATRRDARCAAMRQPRVGLVSTARRRSDAAYTAMRLGMAATASQ